MFPGILQAPNLAGINGSHPLSDGLFALWTNRPGAHHGRGWRDGLNRRHWTLAAATAAPTTKGPSGWARDSGAFLFDGSNDYMSSTSTLDLLAITTLTLGVRMWIDSYVDTPRIAIEASVNYNNNTGAILVIPDESSLKFDLSISTDQPPGFYNGVTFPRPTAGAWHYIVICCDRAAGAQQFTNVDVDGVAQTLTQTDTSLLGTGGFGNYTWYLGGRGGTTFFLPCKMADISIHTRLLTQTERRLLYDEVRSGWRGLMPPVDRFKFNSAAAPPAGTQPMLTLLGVGA